MDGCAWATGFSLARGILRISLFKCCGLHVGAAVWLFVTSTRDVGHTLCFARRAEFFSISMG
eukprot:6368858-Pyramimonas_sp.AAC.1